MHLQQTKVESRASGGPQYYFREKIVSAAIKLSDGSVYAGPFHADALEKARVKHRFASKSVFYRLFNSSEDGFITDRQRFLNRVEAYDIAIKNRQISRNSYAQALKDLWGEDTYVPRSLCALAFKNVLGG
jgi:hypothetical protein